MALKTSSTYIYILLTVLLISSCGSFVTESANITNNNIIYDNEYTYEGTVFHYTPLETTWLQSAHGLDSRYFTDTAGLFPPRLPCIISFKIESDHQNEVEVLYEDAYLTDVEGNRYEAQTREEYYDLWEEKVAVSVRSKINWLFDHYIHKKVILLSGNKQSEGYFIFLMNRPRLGDFTLSVPVVLNDVRGSLSLPVTLELDQYEVTSTEVSDTPVFTPQNN
ncbi:MAG: hypothetical protein PQJ59_16290 [Spirochaetales bacterium]|nr:hypothetical protein [Spirochaetales bacterium]